MDHEGCCLACAAAFRGSWIPDGAEELWAGEGARVCRRFVVFGLDGATFLAYGRLCMKYEKSSLKSSSENK